jgi:ParB/RepB/Spo0J family partition protein
MSKTNEKELEVAKKGVFMSVPVDKVVVVENVRKNFDAEKMKSLTESIKKHGVQQPIVVTKGEKEGTYSLVAGERRWRGTKAAGLAEIPVSLVDVKDAAEFLEIQLLENNEREDLGPIEKARGYKKLLDMGQHTIEGLAASVGKPVKYVARLVRLLELPKAAVKAIEKGTLTPEHGHQLLRAPEDKRETFTQFALTPKWGGGSNVLPTIHDLINEIERRLEKDLSSACFPKDKAYAGAMACTLCPFNTGNQDVLFEGAKDGKCTDGGCYAKKTSTFMREFRDEAAAKKFKDLKFAGYAGQDHGAPREVGETVVLSGAEAKSEAVKALLKKDPTKFAFAVLKPSRFGSKAPSAVLVCNDKDFVAKKLRKAEEPVERGMTEEERAREHFVAVRTNKALFGAAAKSLKAVKKVHLMDIVLSQSGTEEAYEAVGIEAGENTESALKKLSEKDLLRLAWLCTIQHYEMDKRFGDLGVEVKKVRKEARAESLTAWERIQKEEAAKVEAPKEGEAVAS